MGEIFFGDTGPVRTIEAAREPGERALADLHLEPISDYEWRVSDNRLVDDDPAKLLGFIEQNDTGPSAMRLENGHPLPWKKCDSMEQAMALFVIAPPPPMHATSPFDMGTRPKHAADA